MSSKGPKSASTGILFSKDTSGVVTWSTPADSNRRSRRFEALIAQAITTPDNTAGVLAVRLICLDSIHPDALPAIEQSECSTYRVDFRHAIEWKAEKPNRLERRFLSALTVRCWTNQALTGLEQSLVAFLNSNAPYQAITDPVAELKMDFECWLNDVLPASLFAHCCGQSCLSGLEVDLAPFLRTL